MAMTIAQNLPQYQLRASSSNASETPPEAPLEKTMVDKIVDSTYLGANYLASGASGGVTGLGAFVRQAPLGTAKTIGSAYKNLWKTPMIGPNLKTVAFVAAAPLVLAGGALALPFALCAGIFHGDSAVDSSQPRQFTIGQAASDGYTKTSATLEKAFNGCIESLEELGNDKLGENEKPLDIPFFKTVKSVAVGAAGAAIGAAAGLVSAVVSTLSEAVNGIANAVSDERLGLGGKALAAGTAVLSAPVHGAIYGIGTAASTFGRGIAKTWNDDALFGGLGKVFTEAGTGIAAGLLPETMLLQEKPQPPAAG